jgi:hypothetical protein
MNSPRLPILASLVVGMAMLIGACSEDAGLASLDGESSLGATVVSDSKRDPEHKADICHWANSNKVFKINIDSSAVQKHFENHGPTRGPHAGLTDGFPGTGAYDAECNLVEECPCFQTGDFNQLWNVYTNEVEFSSLSISSGPGTETQTFALAGCVEGPGDSCPICVLAINNQTIEYHEDLSEAQNLACRAIIDGVGAGIGGP